MKLSVLVDNHAGGIFKAEHGLSYFIETGEKQLLFDTGHSSLFVENAKKLHIDLKKIDTVVLSHGHWDHGNGLQHLKDKQLIAHDRIFMKRYRKKDHSYVGLNLSEQTIKQKLNVKTSSSPFWITANILFLGEIPRIKNFEAQTTTFIDNEGIDDFIPDDSGLAIIENNQLIVISGCAHAGICNTIEYAKKITGINQVHAVIGGFHLKTNNKQTQKTIEYLKNQQITHLFPAHCTEFQALAEFHKHFQNIQIKTGMQLEF